MEVKKPEALNEQALENVSGGKDTAKYAVGEEVIFVALLNGGTGMNGRVKKKGTITAINGKTYWIRSGIVTYTVKEEDILTAPTVTVETGAHATETGASGSW